MAKRKRTSSGYRLERRGYWQRMISQWHQSGLSQSAFCRRHQLSPQQFSKWKVEIASAQQSKAASEPAFIEITPDVSPNAYEIITPDDFRIRIEGACSPDALSKILAAARSSC